MSHVITIDGPAMAGKSTPAAAVAKALGFVHINTGAVYRALAVWRNRHPDCPVESNCVSGAIAITDGVPVQSMYDDGLDVTPYLYAEGVSDIASRMSENPMVRRAANAIIRKLCEGHNVVLEGRDTGSVLFPDADLKIFLTADVKTRASRTRPDDRKGRTLEQCVDDLAARDARDSTRACDPLVRTDDMILVDNRSLYPEETVESILALWKGIGHVG